MDNFIASLVSYLLSYKLLNESLVYNFLHPFKITIWFPQRLQYTAMYYINA